MGLVIKAQDDWRDVGPPSSCNASQFY